MRETPNDNFYFRLQKVFEANEGYATTNEIERSGISRIYLTKLTNEGCLERVKRGVYYWPSVGLTSYSSLIAGSLIVPKGVICLLSALSYYNLTTYNPRKLNIAIQREMKVSIPKYPPIKLYYFSTKQFEAGIKKVKIGRRIVKIYSQEKTLSDCLKYRNQIGIDIFKESLKEYLRQPDRNLENLIKFAKLNSVEKDMKTYLEVLV